MSSVAGCREIRHALGVYVLGAIDPAERALVDDHLAACPDCREELASLAGLPALLRRVPQAEAERMMEADPAEDTLDDVALDRLLPPLLARTARVRRSHRVRELVAAAAVAVLALGAGAAGASVLHPASAPVAGRAAGPPQTRQVQAWHWASGSDTKTGVTLTVKYRPMPYGTTMTVSVSGVTPGTVCQLEVTDFAGHHWVVGGWRVGNYPASSVWYPASTSLADAQLHSFEVTAGGKVLARAIAA